MTTEQIVKEWFDKWEKGDFHNLPITDAFKHTSPFGTIEGKESYLDLVSTNKDKFLNHTFDIHDIIIEDKKACVRYTANQKDFSLDVTEWHYLENNLITKIIAYYHIGEIREDRILK